MDDPYRPRDDEPGPLASLRVLDLTIARAGPTCVRQLADMGASVIQIQAPHRGDLGGSDAWNLHRNKRSMLLDLKNERGHEVFLKLVADADVLVENFRADVKHRLGIDYETLSGRFPRLIYASVSGFGQDGPYGTRRGVDQIAQGLSGLMSVTGPPGSGPWRVGIAVSDTAAGTFLTQGVLAALYARERSGRGQWVHTSLLESLINFMDFQAARWLIDGVVPGQTGNDHPTLFPMGTFETADGTINIAGMTDWSGFLTAVGAAERLDDERFATLMAALSHRAEIEEIVREKLRLRPSAEWVERLNEAGLPCGPVLAIDEVFDDPQVKHLQLTRRVEHETAGPQSLLRLPLTFSDTPAGVRSAAPRRGAHTREILRECGYEAEEIDALLGAGVAATSSDVGGWER